MWLLGTIKSYWLYYFLMDVMGVHLPLRCFTNCLVFCFFDGGILTLSSWLFLFIYCSTFFFYNLPRCLFIFVSENPGGVIRGFVWVENSLGTSFGPSAKCCPCDGTQWDFSEWHNWHNWRIVPTMFVLLYYTITFVVIWLYEQFNSGLICSGFFF